MSSGLAIIGSTSSHNGQMISASGAKLQTPEGAACIDQDLHQCPISGHGTTPVIGNSARSTINGKSAILNGAVAGCGAIINANFATRVTLT